MEYQRSSTIHFSFKVQGLRRDAKLGGLLLERDAEGTTGDRNIESSISSITRAGENVARDSGTNLLLVLWIPLCPTTSV